MEILWHHFYHGPSTRENDMTQTAEISFYARLVNKFYYIEKTNKKYKEYVQDVYEKVIEHCYERLEQTKVGTRVSKVLH